MLEAALKFSKVFDRMADEDVHYSNYFNDKDKDGNSRVGPPNEDDWQDAAAFCHFLERFYESTLKFSATKSATSHLVFSEMISI